MLGLKLNHSSDRGPREFSAVYCSGGLMLFDRVFSNISCLQVHQLNPIFHCNDHLPLCIHETYTRTYYNKLFSNVPHCFWMNPGVNINISHLSALWFHWSWQTNTGLVRSWGDGVRYLLGRSLDKMLFCVFWSQGSSPADPGPERQAIHHNK